MGDSRRPRVAIIGAGFGGLAAAKHLAGAKVSVTLIDRQNHHVFQPLLYQVATAALSPADIAAPIRSIVKRHKNIRAVLGTVTAIDTAAGRVTMTGAPPVDFDWLIVASGARHSYFGNDEWARYAPGLKTLDDATAVRRNVLLALEHAEIETDKARRDALLTFIVIGGGPTGVEMAGAIAELARSSVSMDFRHITPDCTRVILVDSGARLLRAFPERLSAKAKAALESLGVEVRLGLRITEIHPHGVRIGENLVMAQTIVWAAGVRASPAANWLGCTGDANGRVPVGPDLRPAGHDRIFVIGDTAACTDAAGRLLPGVAPVAKQQGKHAAAAIVAAIAGGPVKPFTYRDYGNLATIGRQRAIADFGRYRLSGFPAWFLWCTVHVWYLAGYRSRIAVGLTWLWHYVTYERHARLITGLEDDDMALVTDAM